MHIEIGKRRIFDEKKGKRKQKRKEKVKGKEKKKQREFMAQSVESINNTVKGLIEKIEMNEAMTSRYRIIRAADEIRNGGELSDDAVEQLAEDLDLYDTFCENHPGYKNHKGRNSRRIVIEYEEKLNEKRRKES